MSSLVRMLAPGLIAVLLIAAPGVARVAQPDTSALTPEERVHGLSIIWKEAAYNFPYFDQLPDLDWDRAYREAIPRVLAAGTTLEYYRELHRFAALLRDGHTRVRLPDSIIQRRPFSSPQVELEAVGGRALVRNASAHLADSLPIGSVLTSVVGKPVDAYLEEEVLPWVFASAPHSRRISAIEGSHTRGYGLLVGRPGTTVSVGVETPAGEQRSLRLTRDRFTVERDWVRSDRSGPRPLLEFDWVERDIAYLALNTFSSARLVPRLDSLLSELRRARGVIIDLRENGGGSDVVAAEVLARFAEGPFVGTASRVRINDAYYRALGSFGRPALERALPDDQAELIERSLRHYRGEAWRFEPRDTLRVEYDGERIDAPVAVLTARGTGSAAENLLVRLPDDGRFFTVGSPTAASTGQPLRLSLPGGGYAQIVTRAALLPDGTPVVRHGIRPDIAVVETVEDIRQGRDPAVSRAVEELRRRSGT